VLRTQSSAHWLSVLQGKLPIGPVLSVEQALANPFVAENGMISQVPHPLRPDFRMLANPLKIDGKRMSQRVCAALGEDNEAILNDVLRRETTST